MKPWGPALRDSAITGLTASIATIAMLAVRGRKDAGSAIAPVNASSHVLWGRRAAASEALTLRHTVPGAIINLGASLWWALVFQRLFGAAVERRGAPAALLGGAATAALAYLLDYRLLPRRLTPGWELRLSGRSLALGLGAMAVGLSLGALLRRRR